MNQKFERIEKHLKAIVKVGDGRGFIFESGRDRLVVTG
jgi:hypothetical protein